MAGAAPGGTGGCACGAVRYRLTALLSDAGYCHCRICQQVSGGPVMAFATVPLKAFAVTRGEPRRRRSSTFGERWFCGDCGSPLAMRVDHQPETIDVALGALDNPAAVVPGFHIWTRSRVPWFEVLDHLPRFDTFRPQTHGLEAGSKRWSEGASDRPRAGEVG